MKSRTLLDNTRVLPKVVRLVINFLIFGLMLIRNFKENTAVRVLEKFRDFLEEKEDVFKINMDLIWKN